MSNPADRLITVAFEARLLELAGDDNPNVAPLVHVINSVERAYTALFQLYGVMEAAQAGDAAKAAEHRERGADSFTAGLSHLHQAVRALEAAAMMGDTGGGPAGRG